jgi:hypothetical protein
MVMGMDRNCQNCTEKCPQAERIQNAALGRMYAMKELVPLLKKIESGELVEVVRCKDCKYWKDTWVAPDGKIEHGYCHMEDADDVIVGRWDDDFCSYGERSTDA